MVAACIAEAEAATARGNSAAGTRFGSSAWVVGISKARAVPRAKARTKIMLRVISPEAGAEHQCHRHQGLAGLAEGGDPASVVAVGNMPGVEHEQYPREEFDQAYQAQVEDIAGQFVDVPANGHGEHLEGAGGADAGQPEGEEGAMAEQGRGFGWTSWRLIWKVR